MKNMTWGKGFLFLYLLLGVGLIIFGGVTGIAHTKGSLAGFFIVLIPIGTSVLMMIMAAILVLLRKKWKIKDETWGYMVAGVLIVCELSVLVGLFGTYGSDSVIREELIILKTNGEQKVVSGNGFYNPFTTKIVGYLRIPLVLKDSTLSQIDIGDNYIVNVKLSGTISLSDIDKELMTNLLRQYKSAEMWIEAVKETMRRDMGGRDTDIKFMLDLEGIATWPFSQEAQEQLRLLGYESENITMDIVSIKKSE